MCLNKTHGEPRIAQDDIEVWKVLTNKGLSPYYEYQYHHGMNKPSVQKMIPVEQQYVDDGYLHAYSDKETAEACASLLTSICLTGYFNMENAIQYVAQRMIIPKGTAYYEGNDGDICAECLYWPAK